MTPRRCSRLIYDPAAAIASRSSLSLDTRRASWASLSYGVLATRELGARVRVQVLSWGRSPPSLPPPRRHPPSSSTRPHAESAIELIVPLFHAEDRDGGGTRGVVSGLPRLS
jgi:hypothetical protein